MGSMRMFPRPEDSLALVGTPINYFAYLWETMRNWEEKLVLVAVVSLSSSDKLRFSGRCQGYPQAIDQ
jgi:hypothetical protein